MEIPTILGSPVRWPGPAVLGAMQWEQQTLDALVADVFGFHALQLGHPDVDALRCNRMPHRWVGLQSLASPAEAGADMPKARGAAVVCDFDALPFPSHSLDLVVLVHALEASRDPHLALREVERVLVPEGRVVVFGFNPTSLWGLRLRWFSGYAEDAWIGYRRLRDWMRLLGFEVDAAKFGVFRPPLASAVWLDRFAWMEKLGQRWWPVLGAVYGVAAVKRVRGMRLVGLARRQARYASAPRPVAVSRQQRQGRRTTG